MNIDEALIERIIREVVSHESLLQDRGSVLC